VIRRGVDVKFGFVAKDREAWPINLVCEAPGVSRGGFYARLTRARSQRSRDDELIGNQARRSFLGSDPAHVACPTTSCTRCCTTRSRAANTPANTSRRCLPNKARHCARRRRDGVRRKSSTDQRSQFSSAEFVTEGQRIGARHRIDGWQVLAVYVEFYNARRPHQSHDGRTADMVCFGALPAPRQAV
jgi:hypothetical protein